MSEENLNIYDVDDISISSLFQKIDRILAEDERISVASTKSVDPYAFAEDNVIGYSDKRKHSLFLNYDLLKNVSKDIASFIILSKGVNYHELAHLMFSPDIETKTKKYYSKYSYKSIINYNEYREAINLCEDCRIENLFVNNFDRASYYFSYAAVVLLLKDSLKYKKSKIDKLLNYFSLYGKKFLNVDISMLHNEINFPEDIIKSVEELIDKYILEKDINVRLDIAFQVAEIISSLKDKERQEEQKQKEKEEQKNKNNNDNKDSKNNKKGNQQNDSESQKQDKKGKKEKEDGNSQTNNSDNNTDKQNINNQQTQENELDKIKSKLEKEMTNIQTDIDKDIDALKALVYADKFANFDGTTFKPSDQNKAIARKIEEHLKILRGNLTSSIKRFQKSGKIDMHSVMASFKSDPIAIFQKRKLNKIDKSRIAVSVLLDSSGSISTSDFNTEIGAAWSLTEAFKKLNNKVEIVEFSWKHRLLKGFNNNGDWKRTYNDSTSVCNPMKLAIKDLLAIKKIENIPNLFLMIVSDGFFDDAHDAKEIMDEARKKGIKILWIFASERLKSDSWRINLAQIKIKEMLPHLDFFIGIDDIDKLTEEFKKFIFKVQKDINKKLEVSA